MLTHTSNFSYFNVKLHQTSCIRLFYSISAIRRFLQAPGAEILERWREVVPPNGLHVDSSRVPGPGWAHRSGSYYDRRQRLYPRLR